VAIAAALQFFDRKFPFRSMPFVWQAIDHKMNAINLTIVSYRIVSNTLGRIRGANASPSIRKAPENEMGINKMTLNYANSIAFLSPHHVYAPCALHLPWNIKGNSIWRLPWPFALRSSRCLARDQIVFVNISQLCRRFWRPRGGFRFWFRVLVWVWAGVRAPVADLCRLIRVYKLP